MEVVSVRPDSPPEHLDGWVELWRALVAEQVPEVAPPSRAECLGELVTDTDDRVETLLAVDNGRPVGAAIAWLPLREDRDQASVDIFVRAELRGRGIGGILADAMTDLLLAAGRSRASADAADRLPGHRFALGRGATETLPNVRSRLDLNATDPGQLGAMAAAVPDGYALVQWTDRCPDDLLEQYARVREGMNDRPMGTGTHEDQVWQPDRVRVFEDKVLRMGQRILTTGAVHRETGEMGGFTVLLVPVDPIGVWQEDTAVVAAHRGHGLGLVIKAANLLRLREHSPASRWVLTWNATGNEHMRAVNERLGFEVCDEWAELELELRPAGARAAG